MILLISRLCTDWLLGISFSSIKPMKNTCYIIPSTSNDRLDKYIVNKMHNGCKYNYHIIKEGHIPIIFEKDRVIYIITKPRTANELYQKILSEQSQDVWLLRLIIHSRSDNINFLYGQYPSSINVTTAIGKGGCKYELIEHVYPMRRFHLIFIAMLSIYLSSTFRCLILFKHVFLPLLILETTWEKMMENRNIIIDQVVLIVAILYTIQCKSIDLLYLISNRILLEVIYLFLDTGKQW